MANNRRIYRTALGKTVDMDSLRIANEKSIAVGNMKVNARGDELGPGGVILKTKAQVEAERNALPEGGTKRVNAPRQSSAAAPTQQAAPQPAPIPEDVPLDPVEEAKSQPMEAVEFPDDIDEQEPFTEAELAEANTPAEEPAPAPTAPMRGSLAASVASEKTVTQELEVDPRKPKGPTRI